MTSQAGPSFRDGDYEWLAKAVLDGVAEVHEAGAKVTAVEIVSRYLAEGFAQKKCVVGPPIRVIELSDETRSEVLSQEATRLGRERIEMTTDEGKQEYLGHVRAVLDGTMRTCIDGRQLTVEETLADLIQMHAEDRWREGREEAVQEFKNLLTSLTRLLG